MSTKIKYTTVSLPLDLVKKIDAYVREAPEYSSRADFVKKATAKELRVGTAQIDSLTTEEKRMLDAWARHRNDLRKVEEVDLGELLLVENGHVWSWLPGKLAHSVDYILKLRSNRN